MLDQTNVFGIYFHLLLFFYLAGIYLLLKSILLYVCFDL